MSTRFTVCTYNVWADSRREEREAPLREFLRFHTPDILCLQELRGWSRELIEEALPTHECVTDDFEGWTVEGNVFWNRELFDCLEYGAEDIGMIEPLRRLFWARLRSGDRTALVSTAHYTWIGNRVEADGGPSPRFEQARRTVEELDRLAEHNEPTLFMGDLNDFAHPIRILREGGLLDSFPALGRFTAPTHPAMPTASGTPQAIDYIMSRGAIRPLTTEVVDFHLGDIAPSDHKPVLATYCLI
ncbi:endonuclease [Candidatus Poribacteria bacterium]|jgi:endonuclease/exonuclease/phosphatase (EEP) superfamily protein YafD|nr:endonuclease [Candidatus Poribacteria bacterium]MBT5536426.1 endonuclease [Candidatus Poribacteria bacterium]MBT7097527.1 endonuclease [Candidatus Poribacteria bacterium]MBT7808362.1 endonuclease [Candidatus Poribacteria bacterium]